MNFNYNLSTTKALKSRFQTAHDGAPHRHIRPVKAPAVQALPYPRRIQDDGFFFWMWAMSPPFSGPAYHYTLN